MLWLSRFIISIHLLTLLQAFSLEKLCFCVTFSGGGMVQGVTLSTLATCGKSMLYGSSQSWMVPFKPFKRSQITSFTGRNCVWNQCVQGLFLVGYPYVSRHSGFKAEAGWIFGRGEQGLDASAEHSESANEDILLFFFQLDLATRVQVYLLLLFYKQLTDEP